MTTECSKRLEHVAQRQSLSRHVLTPTESFFDCVECGKKFPQRFMLKKHMFTHSGERPFRCSVCGDKFIIRYEFEAHKLLHSEEKQVNYHAYGNRFVVKQEVDKHKMVNTREEQLENIQCVRLIPNTKNINAGACQSSLSHCESNCVTEFMKTDSGDKVDTESRCTLCGNVYRSSKSLKRHLKTCGSVGSLNKTKCLYPSCERKFFHVTKMIYHIENEHSGMKVNAKEINFPSLAEFRKWKEEEELKTFSYFSRSSGKSCLKGGVYTYYTCQHDGLDRFHCKSGEAGRTTNRKWVKGRVKTGITCPSRLLVKEFKNGRVSLKYISTHTHEVKFENTKFQPLSSSTLSLIKEQLALGVPPRKIQEKLGNGFLDDHTRNYLGHPLKKEPRFVSVKQLNELRRKLKKNSRVDENDAACIASLVKKLDGSDLNPFVTYKPQGGSVVIGDSDLDVLPYARELFAVGIQTQQQMKIMRDGVARMLYVDFFHFDNDYEFTLLNLMVPDEFGKCYPIAHFITNHKDEKTLSCLFSSLRQRCPNLRIKVVMTDEDSRGISALKAVFGYVRTLLCQKQIRKSWLHKLQAVVNTDETKDEVMSALDALLYEKNEECFQQMCSTFTERFGPVVPDFINYFTKHYVSSPQVWASCYRMLPHPDIDTTTYFMSFHNKLRAYDSKRKFNRKISDLIVLLLEIEKENFLQLEKKLRCGFHSIVLGCGMSSKHARGWEIPDSDVMVCEGTWRVISRHNRNTFYVVNRIAEECRQDLCLEKFKNFSFSGLCAHLFTCSCQDVSGLCKHIHKVCLLTLQQMYSSCQLYHKQTQETCHELKQEVYIEQGKDMCCEHSQESDSEPVRVYYKQQDDVYTNLEQDAYNTESYYTKVEASDDIGVHDGERPDVDDCYAAELQAGYNTDVQDVCCPQVQGVCMVQTKNDFCPVPIIPKVDVELYPAPYAEIVMDCKAVASPTVTTLPSNKMSSYTGNGVQCAQVVSLAGVADCENILSQVETNVGFEECTLHTETVIQCDDIPSYEETIVVCEDVPSHVKVAAIEKDSESHTERVLQGGDLSSQENSFREREEEPISETAITVANNAKHFMEEPKIKILMPQICDPK